MYNWSTNEGELRRNPEKYAIWHLEQMVNFGLDGQKIERNQLKMYWSKINIDPARRRFLELLLNE